METTDDRSRGRRGARGILALGLSLSGVFLWVFCLHAAWGAALQWELTAVAVVAGLVPPLRRSISAALERIRRPSPVERFRAAVFISISATMLFFVLAYVQDWDLILRYQDEHSYAIQAQMLAHGRLWMPPIPPEIADFISSYALFATPRYGSIYFPGTALLNVAAVWLHLPFWMIPVLTGGACVGLIYRLVTELIDGVAGTLAALMLTSLPAFRSLSLMLLSQTPMLLLGLLLIWAWLRWRREQRTGWALAMGVFAGWALVTRPLDALAYLLPICGAMLVDLSAAPNRGREIARSVVLIVLAAAPFLILQTIQNWGMTGRWTHTPEAEFADRNFPAPMLGFHQIDWTHAPEPSLPEDRELLETSTWPSYRTHQLRRLPQTWWNERLPRTLLVTLPSPLLAMLIPVGLLGLTDVRRRALAATSAFFCLLYAFSVWYQAHYVMVIVPGVLIIVLLGVEQLRSMWPGQSVMFTLIIAAMSIGAMAQTDASNWSPWMDLVRIENQLTTLPPDPAIVLFRYHPFNPAVNIAFHEPVYNTNSAWPDDARIIRAHDLGGENIRLFEYYARTQPDRVIYLYDRDGDTLSRLGTPADAARAYDESLRSTHVRQREPNRTVQKNGDG